MAYTPYQQALPDTTLYQRLTDTSYVPQGMRQNPYNPSMLSQEAQDYYADPFGFVNNRFKTPTTPTTSLDELLKPQTSAAKMFDNLGDGGEGGGDGSGGRNYYAEREAQLRSANLPEDRVQSILRAEQEANNSRIAAGLALFSNAMVPGMGAIGVSKYGPTGYADYLQGNARVMMGDTSGYTSPTYTPKPAGVAAPVVSGSEGTTYSPEAIQYSAPGYTSAGSDGSNFNDTPDTSSGSVGADATYGDTSWGSWF